MGKKRKKKHLVDDRIIIGIDEVGLGPVAGPIVVGAVVLPRDDVIKGVRDSKKVSEYRRLDLVHDIDRRSLFWVLAESHVEAIDKYGIRRCNRACMKWCAKVALHRFPNAMVIVDGTDPVPGVETYQQRVVIKADDKFQAVSAASIMAKVHRDKFMIGLSSKWPEYMFHKHKGYLTAEHRIQLNKYGPCAQHRRSYKPVQVAEEKRGMRC